MIIALCILGYFLIGFILSTVMAYYGSKIDVLFDTIPLFLFWPMMILVYLVFLIFYSLEKWGYYIHSKRKKNDIC